MEKYDIAGSDDFAGGVAVAWYEITTLSSR
jgi:hypothetical protein